MKHFRFQNYISKHTNIDEAILNQLLLRCTSKKFRKGDFLLRAGQKVNHSFFVEEGLLRQFSIDAKGKEHILQFAPENWFMSDRESTLFNQPSSYYMEALEDTEVYLIEETLIFDLSKSDERFLEFNTKLLHNHILHLQLRITQLQSYSAEERYLHFVKIYPDIQLRIPQTMVASYLGITPESLSRIRKELAERHKVRS